MEGYHVFFSNDNTCTETLRVSQFPYLSDIVSPKYQKKISPKALKVHEKIRI